MFDVFPHEGESAMKAFHVLTACCLLALPLAACNGGTEVAPQEGAETAASGRDFGGRDQIRIVGSSTVYPFATKVAEQFGRRTQNPTPIIESTGSGGGFKLFCAGIGTDHPDITNSSRAIKESEIETCADNGVEDVTEVKIGYDGIVVANQQGGLRYSLTREQIFRALAKELPNEAGEMVPNPNRTWADVDPSLPDQEIEVYGPPPTSGTRDAFVELVMDEACAQIEAIAQLEETDEERFQQVCQSMREDGVFIEAGENDNLIVQKLDANPNALGIFGFSFLDQNRDVVQGAAIEGVEPTFDAIAGGDYPVSRPLFFYVKNAHVGTVPGIEEYVQEFVSDQASGPEGYLTDVGLIPLPPEERQRVRQAALALEDNVDP
jgi:phosphate transport system substrate-binding protein